MSPMSRTLFEARNLTGKIACSALCLLVSLSIALVPALGNSPSAFASNYIEDASRDIADFQAVGYVGQYDGQYHIPYVTTLDGRVLEAGEHLVIEQPGLPGKWLDMRQAAARETACSSIPGNLRNVCNVSLNIGIADEDNWVVWSSIVMVQIKPASAILRANPAEMLAGAELPELTGFEEGLVDPNDLGQIEYVLDDEGVDLSVPATYPNAIKAMYDENENYEVTVVPADLIVRAQGGEPSTDQPSGSVDSQDGEGSSNGAQAEGLANGMGSGSATQGQGASIAAELQALSPNGVASTMALGNEGNISEADVEQLLAQQGSLVPGIQMLEDDGVPLSAFDMPSSQWALQLISLGMVVTFVLGIGFGAYNLATIRSISAFSRQAVVNGSRSNKATKTLF